MTNVKTQIFEEKKKQNEEKLRYEQAKTQKWKLKANTEEVKVQIAEADFGRAEINLGTANLKGELALAENQYYSQLLPIKQETYAAKLTSAEASKEKALGAAEQASAEVEALFGRSVSSRSLASSSSNSLGASDLSTKKTSKRKAKV